MECIVAFLVGMVGLIMVVVGDVIADYNEANSSIIAVMVARVGAIIIGFCLALSIYFMQLLVH